MVRRFRSCRYDIRIRNLEGLNEGQCAIVVDDIPIKGAVIPEFRDSSVHLVDVEVKKP